MVEDGFWIDKIKSHCYVTVNMISLFRSLPHFISKFFSLFCFKSYGCISEQFASGWEAEQIYIVYLKPEINSTGQNIEEKCSLWFKVADAAVFTSVVIVIDWCVINLFIKYEINRQHALIMQVFSILA